MTGRVLTSSWWCHGVRRVLHNPLEYLLALEAAVKGTHRRRPVVSTDGIRSFDVRVQFLSRRACDRDRPVVWQGDEAGRDQSGGWCGVTQPSTPVEARPPRPLTCEFHVSGRVSRGASGRTTSARAS